MAEEAREKAEQIIGEAKASAERIRADTDRELAAATQRRDSINAQLANVRQMLATLTGTAPFSLTGFGDADEDAWAEPDAGEAPAGAEAAADTDALEEDQADDDETDADAVPIEDESLAHRRS